MPTVSEQDARSHTCPFHEFQPCQGSRCMAWLWDGPAFERCETDNLLETAEGIRPTGQPRSPEGLHWEADGAPFAKGYHRSQKDGLPSGSAQRWVRPRDRALGFCGRVGRGDGDYSMPF